MLVVAARRGVEKTDSSREHCLTLIRSDHTCDHKMAHQAWHAVVVVILCCAGGLLSCAATPDVFTICRCNGNVSQEWNLPGAIYHHQHGGPQGVLAAGQDGGQPHLRWLLRLCRCVPSRLADVEGGVGGGLCDDPGGLGGPGARLVSGRTDHGYYVQVYDCWGPSDPNQKWSIQNNTVVELWDGAYGCVDNPGPACQKPIPPTAYCPRYHPLQDNNLCDPSGPVLTPDGTWHGAYVCAGNVFVFVAQLFSLLIGVLSLVCNGEWFMVRVQ